jgi:hypothetical protein
VGIETLAESHGLSDKKNIMKKFRNQIKALAVPVSFWCSFVHSTLGDLGADEQTNAWGHASQTLKDDPFTATLMENELQPWVARTDWVARHFHRSSYAVEGRNGCLPQIYHNGARLH